MLPDLQALSSPRVITDLRTNLSKFDEENFEQELLDLDLFYDLRKSETNQD